jgi:hypothetical protein
MMNDPAASRPVDRPLLAAGDLILGECLIEGHDVRRIKPLIRAGPQSPTMPGLATIPDKI